MASGQGNSGTRTETDAVEEMTAEQAVLELEALARRVTEVEAQAETERVLFERARDQRAGSKLASIGRRRQLLNRELRELHRRAKELLADTALMNEAEGRSALAETLDTVRDFCREQDAAATRHEAERAAGPPRLVKHDKRPEWGVGRFLYEADGKWHFKFPDVGVKTFPAGFCALKPVDDEDAQEPS
jgi:hypothetical protein